LSAALAAFRALIPPDGAHPWAASARLTLGRLLIERPERRADGLRLLTEAAELREKFLGPADARSVEARTALQAAKAR
jgi:hypothetical protein